MSKPGTGDVSVANIVAALIIGNAGSIAFILSPVLVGALRRSDLPINESQVGLLGSADPTGMFLGAILALIIFGRFDFRYLAAIVLTLNALSNLASVFADTFLPLFILRILAGTAGGLSLAIAYTSFGATPQPDRNFSIFIVVQTIIGILVVSGLARFVEQSDVDDVFMVALSLSLVGLLATPWLMASLPAGEPGTTDTGQDRQWELTFLTAASLFIIGVAVLIVWANIESIGELRNLSKNAIASAVLGGLTGGTMGALFVVYTGKRFGRVIPTASLAGLMLLGIPILLFTETALFFLLGCFFFQFGINLCAYIFGAISKAEPNGRLTIVFMLSFKAGFSVAPAFASQLILFSGYQAVIVVSAVMLLITFFLFTRILIITKEIEV